MNQNAFHDLSYGVYVISTKDGGRDVGCIANSSMQVTSSPATVAVSINHDNYTNSCIANSGVFAVSVLPENIDQSVIGTFGFKSSRDTDKFSSVASAEKSGVRVLLDATGYIICRVIDTLETSTHTVFLGEVTDADVLNGGEPMTYAYYHRVIKGKSPKNAPTYIEENTESSKAAKCSVCGYVYDDSTPFDELPEGYTCPVCGVPKSLFKYE